jgi:hypothetical protein
MSHSEAATRSVLYRPRTPPKKRNLHKVPFVELFAGRLQGVVSSKGDYRRVYVSFFSAGTGEYYCSTNNNRRCGGLRGSPCKHLDALVKNAVAQYGVARVRRYLGMNPQDTGLSAWNIVSELSGTAQKTPANEVFSRFLDYLRYVELPGHGGPVHEMGFFVTG